MPDTNMVTSMRGPLASLLTWLVPGLGHVFGGYKARGLIFFVTITATFWTGVAIGGVHHTIDPEARKAWFLAQFGTVGNTAAALALHQRTLREVFGENGQAQPPHWASVEIGVHYTGVAGLLNLLVILDAFGRAETGPGSPVGRRRRAGHPVGVT